MADVIGKVSKINEKGIWVNVQHEACSKCASHGHCRIMDTNNNVNILVEKYDGKIEVGNYVELYASPKRVFLLSFLLYMFPVLMFLGFAVIFQILFYDDIITALMGLIGAFIAFMIIRIIDKKSKKHFKHKITRVIK